MTLEEALRYGATSAGVNAAVGVVLSFVAEVWPAYHQLTPRSKRLVMLALCLAVPLGSVAGLWLVSGEPITLEVLWSALVAGAMAFSGSQVAHARMLPVERWEKAEPGEELSQSVGDEVVALLAQLIAQEKRRRSGGKIDDGLERDMAELFGGER